MKVTPFTKRAIAVRREERWARANGWRKIEAAWELHRGFMYDHRISEVKISVDGKHLLFRMEKASD